MICIDSNNISYTDKGRLFYIVYKNVNFLVLFKMQLDHIANYDLRPHQNYDPNAVCAF